MCLSLVRKFVSFDLWSMVVGIMRLERRKETIGRYYLDSKCDVYMCLKCFFFFFSKFRKSGFKQDCEPFREINKIKGY